MSPLSRNLALTAAALSLPAIAAAIAGPDRMRRLPGQMRDLIQDDTTVEGQLKRLTHRLNELTDDLHLHSSNNDALVQAGRTAAIVGAVLLIPAALAAWIGPERIAQKAREYRDDWYGDDAEREPTAAHRFRSDLDDLDDDIERQREDAFAAVTGEARSLRD